MYKGTGNLREWVARSARKAFLMGPLIFEQHMILILFLGIDILSSFYIGWWVTLEYYYYYKYLLM